MLDSLEYGFDVEVVGAVGVDVLELGGVNYSEHWAFTPAGSQPPKSYLPPRP